jgi:hypothetical protein
VLWTSLLPMKGCAIKPTNTITEALLESRNALPSEMAETPHHVRAAFLTERIMNDAL